MNQDGSVTLPKHLHACFVGQKRAMLHALHRLNISYLESGIQPSENYLAMQQLTDLIGGTVHRAEGNSCLLLGPRGSGKSPLIELCLRKLPVNPIVIRLSGWVQNTDRKAMHEIFLQVSNQTGSSILQNDFGLEQENTLRNKANLSDEPFDQNSRFLPTSSRSHALIPILLTLSRPVIVILDAFDLFTLHPRQFLLYCLLDTVQNCSTRSERQGIAVIGVSSRMDTVQLLEKRVKSRFSGRTIFSASPANFQTCLKLIRSILEPTAENAGSAEWQRLWANSVAKFLSDGSVVNALSETFSITKDFKMMNRILTACILQLRHEQPFLCAKSMVSSIETQRSRLTDLHLSSLSYPCMCLLAASYLNETAGFMTFTFELLYEIFRDQVRVSTSAPVQINGGSIGMVRCTREVLISSFEHLSLTGIFDCIANSPNYPKEFTEYRCVIDRGIVKTVVEKSGQSNLKKWLHKPQ